MVVEPEPEYVDTAADMAAYDQLPPRLRTFLDTEAPVGIPATAVLELYNDKMATEALFDDGDGPGVIVEVKRALTVWMAKHQDVKDFRPMVVKRKKGRRPK